MNEFDEPLELPCVHKMSFDTKAEAEATAVVADWQHGAQLRVYLCRHCNLWHLASK